MFYVHKRYPDIHGLNAPCSHFSYIQDNKTMNSCGSTNFTKIEKTHPNSRRQNGDKKEIPHWGPIITESCVNLNVSYRFLFSACLLVHIFMYGITTIIMLKCGAGNLCAPALTLERLLVSARTCTFNTIMCFFFHNIEYVYVPPDCYNTGWFFSRRQAPIGLPKEICAVLYEVWTGSLYMMYRPQTKRWSRQGSGHVWRRAGDFWPYVGLQECWWERQTVVLPSLPTYTHTHTHKHTHTNTHKHTQTNTRTHKHTQETSIISNRVYKRVHCGNALRIGSGNCSWSRIAYARASIAFLAGLIFCSAGRTFISVFKGLKCTHTVSPYNN